MSVLACVFIEIKERNTAGIMERKECIYKVGITKMWDVKFQKAALDGVEELSLEASA